MHLMIVEDHSLVREGLRMILDATLRFDRCWECGSLAGALARAAEAGSALGLVILDLGLPDASGLGALDRILAACPGVPVIVVSGGDEPEVIDAAFARGARGYVPKNSSGPTLRAAVETVLGGEPYAPPGVQPRRTSAPHGTAPSPAPAQLTPRQLDVLRLLARGLANKEIAAELGMSESTVRVHVTAVLRALGVENRTQAALSELAKNLVG